MTGLSVKINYLFLKVLSLDDDDKLRRAVITS